MIDFKKARYVKSAPSNLDAPGDGLPFILLIGRSNVGKSTLLNTLCGQRLAFSSKKAGKTKLLNFFLIDDRFYLVDAPGYGSTIYANRDTILFSKMMEDILKDKRLKGVCFLLDLRHKPGKDDYAFCQYLQDSGKPITYVLTKCDQMNQKELHQAQLYAGEMKALDPVLSKGDIRSLEPLKGRIDRLLH